MSREKLTIIEPFFKKEKKLKEISEEEKIPYSTLKRWIKSYKLKGEEGLKKKKRSDKGSFTKVDKKTMAYIKNEYSKNPNMSITELYKNYLKKFKESSNNLISYNTIYRIAINIDSFSAKHIKNNIKNIRKPNTIYRLSTEKIAIKIDTVDKKKSHRDLTIVVLYDVYDDSILNYQFYEEKLEIENYILFIHSSIMKNKMENFLIIPENIIIDRVKINKNMRIGTSVEGFNLKISGIEENNSEITRFVKFLEKDITTLSKYNPITLDYLNTELDDFICSVSPRKVPEERRIYDFNKIDILLEKTQRKIQNSGIRFKKNIYNHEKMKKYVGEEVTVMYNSFDLEELKIYLKNKFICSIACSKK